MFIECFLLLELKTTLGQTHTNATIETQKRKTLWVTAKTTKYDNFESGDPSTYHKSL